VKILWHSVKPTIGTGYGTQTALWSRALVHEGYDVIISCVSGLFGSVEMWNGIKMLPHSNRPLNYGMDVVVEHAKRLAVDIVWSWHDAFVMWPDEVKKIPWAAWVPVDSDPLMSKNVKPLESCCWTVGPSLFGQRMLREAGLKNPLYVPCAFDPSVMYPSQESRESIRERFGKIIKKDLKGKFLVNVVSANCSDRKNFPAIFQAWKAFYEKHPDSLLYLHTEGSGTWSDGMNLFDLMKLYDINLDSILMVSQWHYTTGQLGEDYLNLMYNASDVHLNTCVGEGFGLPIMDAQACGCPTIVPDFAAAGEIGFGIKVKKGFMWPLVPGGFQFLVDPAAVTVALEEAYDRKEDSKWRAEMTERSEPYEVSNVMEKHMVPVLKQIEGELK